MLAHRPPCLLRPGAPVVVSDVLVKERRPQDPNLSESPRPRRAERWVGRMVEDREDLGTDGLKGQPKWHKKFDQKSSLFR